MRYLYGPGRHNEHENPRLVGCWRGDDQQVLARLQPALGTGGVHDVRGLTGALSLPLALRAPRASRAGAAPGGGGVGVLPRAVAATRDGAAPVWHCALRAAPGDRLLNDTEWGQIAKDLLDRVGIAPAGDDGGCRWAAVRHDDDSIHVVAVLARQDGRRFHLYRDFPKVRAACQAAERSYGLAPTGPADGTAAVRPARAETEKAARTAGSGVPARELLHRQVRAEATAATSTADLFARLAARGVLVRPRHSTQPGREQEVTGYSVALPTNTTAGGQPVWFGGSKLAGDLGLPALRARYGEIPGPIPDAGTVSPATLVRGDGDAAGRGARLQAVTKAAGDGERLLAGLPADLDAAGVLAAAGDAVHSTARATEGTRGGPLTDAALSYDRATRVPYPRREQEAGQLRAAASDAQLAAVRLRTAARTLARSGHGGSQQDAAQTIQLVAALIAVAIAAARLHESRQRNVQAAAATQTAQQLRAWQHSPAGKAALQLAQQQERTQTTAQPRSESRQGPDRPRRRRG